MDFGFCQELQESIRHLIKIVPRIDVGPIAPDSTLVFYKFLEQLFCTSKQRLVFKLEWVSFIGFCTTWSACIFPLLMMALFNVQNGIEIFCAFSCNIAAYSYRFLSWDCHLCIKLSRKGVSKYFRLKRTKFWHFFNIWSCIMGETFIC